MKILIYSSFVLLLVVLLGCKSVTKVFEDKSPTPRETYVRGLERSNLGAASMVRTWLDAGNPEGHDSVQVALPFREVGFFAAAEPQARFYKFEAKEGQVLTLTSLIKAKERAAVFIDLFAMQDTLWTHIEHADSTLTITHEFTETNNYLVRIQPELLVNVYYSVTLSVTPVLLNPVKGASNKSIGSFYGDPRDGGKRKHEGIDIFAPKGTPVVAPTDGVVRRVGYGGLGGKTVWMYDSKRSHSYYFAHLDSQFVKAGMKLKQGDTIGSVGNTGNARYTPSHLHFGVYQERSKDPVAYIRTMERLVNELTPDTLFQSLVFRVLKNETSLRSGPSSKLRPIRRLERDAWLKITAQSGEWYRAVTGEGSEGYVLKSSLAPADKGKRLSLKGPTPLLSQPDAAAAPIADVHNWVEYMARYNDFLFVKTNDEVYGWISIEASKVKPPLI